MVSIIISNSSDRPLYRQIADQIKRGILDGEINSGESLPSIRALAAELSISVITTKRAYDELETQGLIETYRGRGCFAAGDNELLRERRLRMLEEHLEDALKQAAYLGLSQQELISMLRVLQEDNDGLDT